MTLRDAHRATRRASYRILALVLLAVLVLMAAGAVGAFLEAIQ